MPDEPEDDNPQDMTVYDLAERVAAGRILTVAANQELEDERWRMVHELIRIGNGDGHPNTPQGNAQTILWFKAELTKLLASMQ